MPRRRKRGGGAGGLRSDAVRDVKLSYGPALDAIRQSKREAKRTYRRGKEQIGGIYDALGRQLGDIGQGYGADAQQISDQFGSDLSSFADMLGSTVPGVPQSEINAGAGLFGAIGAGGLENLASQRARNAAYNTSAERQGGIEEMTYKRNALQDMMDFNRGLSQQRVDLMRRTPAEIRARLDELRRIAFDQGLAGRELALKARALNMEGGQNAWMQNFWAGLPDRYWLGR